MIFTKYAVVLALFGAGGASARDSPGTRGRRLDGTSSSGKGGGGKGGSNQWSFALDGDNSPRRRTLKGENAQEAGLQRKLMEGPGPIGAFASVQFPDGKIKLPDFGGYPLVCNENTCLEFGYGFVESNGDSLTAVISAGNGGYDDPDEAQFWVQCPNLLDEIDFETLSCVETWDDGSEDRDDTGKKCEDYININFQEGAAMQIQLDDEWQSDKCYGPGRKLSEAEHRELCGGHRNLEESDRKLTQEERELCEYCFTDAAFMVIEIEFTCTPRL